MDKATFITTVYGLNQMNQINSIAKQYFFKTRKIAQALFTTLQNNKQGLKQISIDIIKRIR